MKFEQFKSKIMSDICQAYRIPQKAMQRPSKERGCTGKANLGSGYKHQAESFALKHGKKYAVYRCPHCGGTHMTTKLSNIEQYRSPLYVTLAGKSE